MVLNKMTRFTSWIKENGGWGTFTLAVVATLALYVSWLYNQRQLNESFLVTSAQTVLNFNDRYNSADIRKERKQISSLLLAHHEVDITDYRLLDNLDMMGMMVNHGTIDAYTAWNEFEWPLECYVKALISPTNQIEIARKRADDPIVYKELIDAYTRFTRISAEKEHLKNAEPSDEDVEEFLKDERKLK